MASKLPPVHPYSIMLYQISKYLSGEKEKIVDLARIMGLRKVGAIDNAADLFDKLEDEDYLSEFKVADLRKALDIIDLHEAARKVKGYEEKALEDKTDHTTSDTTEPDHPPPYQEIEGVTQERPVPPNNVAPEETQTEASELPESSTLELEADAENESNSTTTDGVPPIKEEGCPVDKVEKLLIPEGFGKENESLPSTTKIPKEKRHRNTISGISSNRAYPALHSGIFQPCDK